MSIIKAARKAFVERNEKCERQQLDLLVASVERVLAGYAPPKDHLVPEKGLLYGPGPFLPRDEDEDIATGWSITVEGMQFALHGRQLYVHHYDEDGADGPMWYWAPVNCFADLGAYTYEVPTPQEDVA